MNKFERLAAAVAGRPVDYIPSAFWYHFPEDQWQGSAATKAHIDFYRALDSDVVKVMNETRYTTGRPIERLEEWAGWKPLSVRNGYYQPQIDLLKSVTDQIGDEVPVLATIHGVYISAFHGSRRPECTFDDPHVVTDHIRHAPHMVAPGLEAVTDTLIELSLAFVEAGAHGIYYSSIGGEKWRFSQDIFENHLKPFEMRLLNELKSRDIPVYLHVCKHDARLESYADYPALAVNWAVHESDYDMVKGRKLFNKTVLGGFDDRSGVLVEGSDAEIAQAVRDIVGSYGREGLILGADCTLPTEISMRRIRHAIGSVRDL